MKNVVEAAKRVAGKTLLLSAWLAFYSVMAAAAEPRIRTSLDVAETFPLQNSVGSSIHQEQNLGPLKPETPLQSLTIYFSMTASQQADLLQLLHLQQTRHSNQFHKWLTPEQFAERFGLNQSDIEKVTQWLETSGFTNIHAAPSRNSVSFSATAGQLESSFHANIHQFVRNGTSGYANVSEPQLPRALHGIVESIHGLSRQQQPQSRLRPRLLSDFQYSLVPSDFAIAYDVAPLYGQGFDGTGTTIAIAGQSDIANSDIQAFRTAAGLPAGHFQTIVVGTDPGTTTTGDSSFEAAIQWAGGIAKGATVVYVNSTDSMTSAQYAVQNDIADVLEILDNDDIRCEASLSASEVASFNALFQQANSQGISVVIGSGDQGAWCASGLNEGVDALAASPYVTAVGGTTIQAGSGYWTSSGQPLGYVPEVAWSGGGGPSTFNSKPGWQTGTGVPNDGARDVPDISLAAAPYSYLACYNQNGLNVTACANGFYFSSNQYDLTVYTVGGTEVAAAAFAGIAALIVQENGNRQGNLNPTLYAVASVSPDAFHDVTTGSNAYSLCSFDPMSCVPKPPDPCIPCVTGYQASTGYDLATGLGSIDAYNLAKEWNGEFQLLADTSSVTLKAGHSGTASVAVTVTSNFKGAVKLSCQVSGITDYSCIVPGVTNSAGAVTVLLNPIAAASFPLPGALLLGLFVSLLLPKKKLWALTAMFCLVSCGGGNSTPVPDEHGSISVTGVSGLYTANVSIPLDVTH